MFVEDCNYIIIQEWDLDCKGSWPLINTDKPFYQFSVCINEEYLHLII